MNEKEKTPQDAGHEAGAETGQSASWPPDVSVKGRVMGKDEFFNVMEVCVLFILAARQVGHRIQIAVSEETFAVWKYHNPSRVHESPYITTLFLGVPVEFDNSLAFGQYRASAIPSLIERQG